MELRELELPVSIKQLQVMHTFNIHKEEDSNLLEYMLFNCSIVW